MHGFPLALKQKITASYVTANTRAYCDKQTKKMKQESIHGADI